MGPCCLLSRGTSCWTNQAIDFKSGLPSTHCLCLLQFLPTLFAPLAPVCSCFRSILSPLLDARLGLLRRQLLVQHCESNTDWVHGSHHSLSVTRASGGEPVLLLFPSTLQTGRHSRAVSYDTSLQSCSAPADLPGAFSWFQSANGWCGVGFSLLVYREHPSHSHKCRLRERQELENTPLIHQVTLQSGLHTVTAASHFREITKLASLRFFFRRGSLGWFLSQSLAIGPFKPGSWVWPLSNWQTDPGLPERENQEHPTSGLLCAVEIFRGKGLNLSDS